MSVSKPILLVMLLLYTAVSHQTLAESKVSRVEEILTRLTNPNKHRDHVSVVAHRGSWWHDGSIILAENSISAIDRAIDIGAEIVELDVRETFDKHFVLLHDDTLDRTTTCSGKVARKKLIELKGCKLIVEGTNKVINETVTTLEKAFLAAQDRILVNVDLKLDVQSLIKVLKLANKVGVGKQIIVKAPIYDHEQLKEVEQIKSRLNSLDLDYHFMPIVDERTSAVNGLMEEIYQKLNPIAAETIATFNEGEAIFSTGGVMFNFQARALAVRQNVHLWLNTIYYKQKKGFRSGGRADEVAVYGGLPKEVWGFWADNGVTIFQTDEPELAINWLKKHGYRKPYTGAIE